MTLPPNSPYRAAPPLYSSSRGGGGGPAVGDPRRLLFRQLYEYVRDAQHEAKQVEATHRLLELAADFASRREIYAFPQTVQLLVQHARVLHPTTTTNDPHNNAHKYELKWRSLLVLSLLCCERANHADILCNNNPTAPPVLNVLFDNARHGFASYAIAALSVLFTAPGVWSRSDFISALTAHASARWEGGGRGNGGPAFWALRNVYNRQRGAGGALFAVVEEDEEDEASPCARVCRFWRAAQSVWTLLALRPFAAVLPRRLPLDLVKLTFKMLNG